MTNPAAISQESAHQSNPVGQLARRVRGVGRGSAVTLLARVADVGMTWAFYAVLARSLSAVEFGQLILGFTILQAAATIARFGLDQALLAVAPAGSVNRLCAQVVIAISVAGAVGAALVFRFLWAGAPPFAIWLALGLPAVALSQLIIGALRARGDVPLAALADSVVQPASACIFAFAATRTSPSTAGFALAFVTSWAALLPFALRLEWGGPRLESHATKALLRTGRSMVAVTFLQQAASSEILVLGLVAATSEVGRYAVVQKIATGFVLLHSSITIATTPFMRSLAADPHLLARYYRLVARCMVAVSLPLLVVTLGQPTYLLSLFGRNYDSVSAPLAILSLAGLVVAFSGPAGSVLLCTGQARRLLRITMASTAVLLLSVALFGRYGALGAAFGVLAGRLVARGLLMNAIRPIVRSLVDGPLLVMLGGLVGALVVTRESGAWLGETAAVAVGCAIVGTVALIVLVRTRDVALLISEFRRTPKWR